MPFFPDEWITELLGKVNIVDLVGEYVSLKQKSGRWWACCPFHNEKTPSFSVNPDKGFFHCFGCGKGGNAIHFVMEMDKLTFPEACTHLAEKVKMPVPEQTGNAGYEKRKALREKIYAMNKIAARHFHAQLYSPAGKNALAYLKGRGLSDGVIKTFGLGFAPESWDTLLKLLEKEGYTKQEMAEAGLVKLGEGKAFDMFRNRAMMPIINTFSEVIGFGGRVMDDKEPKYLNSPETAAFSKSKNLYNMNLVRRQKNLQFMVLAEGYMDVIALYSHGVQNCVATLGTALTPDQARIVKRYVNMVYLSYDGDSAGRKAALRAIDVLEKEFLECRVVVLPNGEDPDDFLRAHGKEGYDKLLKAAKSAIDFKFDAAAEPYDLSDGYQKEQYARDCIEILRGVQSAVLKEKYAKNLAARTGFSEHSILQDLGVSPGQQKTRYREEAKPVSKKRLSAADKAENYIVARLCANPDRASDLSAHLSPGEFQNGANAKIISYIFDRVKKGFLPKGDEILSVLVSEEETSHAARLLESDTDVLGQGKNADSFLSDCVKRVKIRNAEQALQAAVEKNREELTEPEKKEVREQIRQLTESLHKMKENL